MALNFYHLVWPSVIGRILRPWVIGRLLRRSQAFAYDVIKLAEEARELFVREPRCLQLRVRQALYCTVLYCTVLYCTVLYVTVRAHLFVRSHAACSCGCLTCPVVLAYPDVLTCRPDVSCRVLTSPVILTSPVTLTCPDVSCRPDVS